MPRLDRRLAVPLAVLAALALVACGGDSPFPVAPTSFAAQSAANAQGVTLSGTVLGSGSSSSVSALSTSFSADTAEPITVSVEGTDISTTVDSDGTFTLRGLPEGSFTLVFTDASSAEIGRLEFSGVLPNQEITLTVDISEGVVIVLEERRNGIGHGDVEIEGLVEEVQTLYPAGDSIFLIAGYTVVARPGETAIREGNQGRTVEDVTEGRRVHVKGVWLQADSSTQQVLAHEIILQGDDEDDTDTGGGCMIEGCQVGAGIQLEGHVDSGSAPRFMLRVEGNRARYPVEIDASGASFKCTPQAGPNAPTPAECQAEIKPGAKVHVSGDLTSCDASSALVKAREVISQGN